MNLASNWKGAGPSDGRSVGLSSGWGGDRIVPLGLTPWVSKCVAPSRMSIQF